MIKTKTPWLFFAVLAAVCALAIVQPIFEYGNTEDAWRYANRYLVRIGLPLYLLSFIASAWHILLPSVGSKFTMRKRRYLGLGFALAHFTHLFAIFCFFAISDETLDIVTLIGGGSTYVFIGLMAITSNSYSVKKLGKYWRYLHKAGTYSIWAVFFVSYLGRVSEHSINSGFGLIFVILLAAYVVRMVAFFTKRSRLNARHGQCQSD